MNQIILESIKVESVIGYLPEEKETSQTLLVSLKLDCDFAIIQKTDSLEDTVDYVKIVSHVRKFCTQYRGNSLEKMADCLACQVKENFLVNKVSLTIEKPRYTETLQIKKLAIYVER